LPFDKFRQTDEGGNVSKDEPFNIRSLISKELQDHKELIEEGNGDSSCGSDEEPSEGNLLSGNNISFLIYSLYR
jgi:hypothetical protein